MDAMKKISFTIWAHYERMNETGKSLACIEADFTSRLRLPGRGASSRKLVRTDISGLSLQGTSVILSASNRRRFRF